MKAHIVQIGNSQGLRIPKVLLEESGIKGEVELELCPDGILLKNITKPRSDWDKRFQHFAEQDDDAPIDASAGRSDFETREWQW